MVEIKKVISKHDGTKSFICFESSLTKYELDSHRLCSIEAVEGGVIFVLCLSDARLEIKLDLTPRRKAILQEQFETQDVFIFSNPETKEDYSVPLDKEMREALVEFMSP